MEENTVLWEEELRVRYFETDQMGTVHHAHLPVYFETARSALFKHFIKSYAAIERRGIFAPVVAISLDIQKPAFYEDQLIIRVRPFDFSGVRLTLTYEVINKNTGDLLATGLTTNVFVDEERRPVNLRNRFPDIYNKVVAVFQNPDDEDFI